MKKIIITIVLLFGLHCVAQNTIIDIPNWNGETNPPNFYLKDVNHILDNFVGTWLYTNATTSLKIVFEKREYVHIGNYYEDILIGEYQYYDILNNTDLFNTLPNLQTALSSEYHHNIFGNSMPTTFTPFDNPSPIRRVKLFFQDNIGGNMNIQKITVNGQEAIEILKVCSQATHLEGQPTLHPILPDGFYTLIKQP